MSNTATAEVTAAIYARVSSDTQAQAQTIDSQVADLRKQVATDGARLDEQNCFLDDGVSGSTLNRPALERLRDAAYVGGFKAPPGAATNPTARNRCTGPLRQESAPCTPP